MKFCVETLGCKVNQYETQSLESILTSRGHTLSSPGGHCDVCIINTCAVTAESARKSRQAVRRMKKLEPDALIAVCGCLSQLEPEKALPLGADLVGGSGGRAKFADEIERLFKERQFKIVADDPFERRFFEELPPGGGAGRTRAMLKIQDGCENFCTYCIIPRARGKSRSLPVERAAINARRLADEGFREIVITGIEISSYGKDLPGGPTLIDAVRAIGGASPSARLRIGSLDPGAMSDSFCRELSGISNLCGHFHLSLQSGCNETLRRMGRRYDTHAVLKAISSLRRFFPDCGVTADLIVGFPGETDEEFDTTLEFIKSAKFSDMHIFPFSPRPGTPAAIMPDQVEKSVRRERASLAAGVAVEMSRAFRLGQIGKIVGTLIERERGGFWTGHSENYLEISLKSGGTKNSVHSVQITGIENGVVWGEFV